MQDAQLPLPALAPTAADRMLDQLRDAPARTNAGFTGKDFEKEIERTAEAYQTRGIARLRKVDPPVAVIWPVDPKTGQKRQRVIFKRNPWPDFAGVWTARGGRALMIEVKSTSNHRLGLRDGQLGHDQIDALVGWRRAGAVSAVLWRFDDRCRLFTAEALAEAVSAGLKSIEFEAGEIVTPGNGRILWDFLGTLERIYWPEKVENKS